MFNKQNMSYEVLSTTTSTFVLHGSGWGLSVKRIRFKLTNIKTKTKKLEKPLKTNIINFKAIGQNLTALSNFNRLTLS